MPNSSDIDKSLISRLAPLIDSEKLHHAYIFEGAAYVDKYSLAIRFAKALLCTEARGRGCNSCPTCIRINAGTYEDLFTVEAEGIHIKDEAIESLQEKLKNKPMAGIRNIAVIKDADRMTVRAQNRFLKSLEEPAAGTVILLLSENRENLIQTIRSRCNIFNAEQISDFKGEELEEAERLIELLEMGEKFHKIKAEFNGIFTDREKACKLLEKMEMVYRNKIVSGKGMSRYSIDEVLEFVHLIEETVQGIRREHGLNAGYAMKKLVINIWRIIYYDKGSGGSL